MILKTVDKYVSVLLLISIIWYILAIRYRYEAD